MIETDLIAKIFPKWLEIEKSSPNKPAVILSQKFGLSRNIKKYPFLKNATALEKDKIFAEVADAVEKSKIFDEKKTAKINLKDNNYLIEALLFEKDIIPFQTMNSDWSRGVLADGDEKSPVILMNMKNHLEITLNSPFGKEIDTLAKLNETDNILGEELLYAYDSRLGFMMPNPEECGNGIFTEFVAHMPGIVLTEEINEVLNGISIMGARVEGVQNQGMAAWGSFFRITANFSDIENENEIVEKNKEIQNALIIAETKARKRLFKEAKLVMEDKIFRSFAMMKYARIMPVSQLFNFISLLRLGSEYKIFQMNMRVLNLLFERGFTANMLLLLDISDTTDIDCERAKMYRELLKNIDLDNEKIKS